jgi:hypothetical protein
MRKFNDYIKWGAFGGLLGGLIAIIGFWILRPVTDSLVFFVGIRCIVGAVVAMIAGPTITKLGNKKKKDLN